MIISSWNVLHHVHALNWGELPSEPDEPTRIAAIAARVHELLRFSFALCLQEVSGDQLRALSGVVPHVCSFQLPRVPRPRRAASVLVDASEHLAVVSMLPGTVLEQRAFASDLGKGFIAVQLANGLIVVSTHISYGDKASAQLEQLAAWVRQLGRPVVIGGDFNADREAVQAMLGAGFSFAPLEHSGRPSRPRTTVEGKSQHIDHVIGHLTQGRFESPRSPADAVPSREGWAGVEDGRGLSDHNPVWAKFE